MKHSPPDSSTKQQQDPGPAGQQHMPSSQLFGHARILVIEHGGEIYRLRITRNNKLILTK